MKDFSKVKFVKPSADALDITKGKVYPVIDFNKSLCLHSIFDDDGFKILINLENDFICTHLRRRNGVWIPCDENGKELGYE